MRTESLTALTRHPLEAAPKASSGRNARTLYGGHDSVLRRTLIALVVGTTLDEDENPGEATLQVLHGRVTLGTADSSWNGIAGLRLSGPTA